MKALPAGRIRAAMIGVSAALALVIIAPVLLSSQDLYAWGRAGLGLPAEWAWFVPLALDMAAVSCIGMTIVAAWRRERPGVFELLVWVFAGASAFAQYRHGMTSAVRASAPDAYVAFPAFALLGPVLLHVTLSRLRRWARADSGEQMSGAAGFGSRWIPGVAFRETLAAWAASRREGIDSAASAVAYVREVRALRGLSDTDALRYAWQALGHFEPYAARVWLQARGVMVDQAAVDTATAARLAVPVAPVSPAPRPPVTTGRAAVPVAVQATVNPPAALDPEVRAARPDLATAVDLSSADYHREQLARMGSNRDRIRYAFATLGIASAGPALRWLEQHGHKVSRTDAYAVARSTVDGPSGAYATITPLRPADQPTRVNGHAPAIAGRA